MYALIHCTHDYFIHATCSINAHISHLLHNPFWRYTSNLQKVPQMTQNYLEFSRSKDIHPKSHNIICFALGWAVFKLRTNLGQIVTCSRLKVHIYAYGIHPRGLNFRPFRSTMSCFWVTHLVWKRALHGPNDLDMFKVKVHICILYTLPITKFSGYFSLRWLVFELRPNFGERSTKWPQNDIDMFKVKVTDMHNTYIPGTLTLRSLSPLN